MLSDSICDDGAMLDDLKDEVADLRAKLEEAERERDALKERNHNQRKLIDADPVAQLAALNGLMQEPLGCGHPLDCLDDEGSGKCAWCERDAALAKVAELRGLLREVRSAYVYPDTPDWLRIAAALEE